MSNETKFPEEYLSYLQDRAFSSTKVKDWFKRCIEEHDSITSQFTGSYGLAEIGLKEDRWFKKWFSQFYDTSKGSKTDD